MGKIVPGNFDAGNSGESTYLGGEPMDDNQRIEGVETNLQKTREAMIAGFGDVKEAIAKTETSFVKEISEVKASTASEIGGAKESALREIGSAKESATNKTFIAMGIVVGVIAIAVTILIVVLGN